MNAIELAVGVALVLVLLGMAIYFGWRQRQTRKLLQQNTAVSPIERTFLSGQVRRRTICCVLLALFALVLGGWFFIEGDFDQLGPSAAAADEAGKKELKESLWLYTGYWIGALVLLMIIVALAAADFLATARYGLKRKRRLLDDHHAVLALEAARLRQKRDEM